MNQVETELFRDKRLGFFIFLSVEAVMFLTLFATYLIFTPSSEGPHPSEVFETTSIIISSVFLLSSSGTLMLSERGLVDRELKKLLPWLGITLLFALVFLGLEINEFYNYVQEGYTLSTNSFLSSYYVLVGLHAAHVAFGSGWMIVLSIQLRRHFAHSLYIEKYKIFTYYWHFVDIVWIGILLIVYARFIF